MNYQQNREYYRNKYKRFKRSSKDFEGLLLEYKNNPSDELKMTLFYNVARLALDVIFNLFRDKPNKLDEVTDDYMSIAFTTFERSLKSYDVTTGYKLTSYFKSNFIKDAKNYYDRYHSVNGVILPNSVYKQLKKGKMKQTTVKSLSGLSVGYLSDYDLDNDGNKLNNYIMMDDDKAQLIPGINDYYEIVKPMILNKMTNSKKESFVEQFERFYLRNPNNQPYEEIAVEYGISRSGYGYNVAKVLDVIKQLVAENDEIRTIMFDLLN